MRRGGVRGALACGALSACPFGAGPFRRRGAVALAWVSRAASPAGGPPRGPCGPPGLSDALLVPAWTGITSSLSPALHGPFQAVVEGYLPLQNMGLDSLERTCYYDDAGSAMRTPPVGAFGPRPIFRGVHDGRFFCALIQVMSLPSPRPSLRLEGRERRVLPTPFGGADPRHGRGRKNLDGADTISLFEGTAVPPFIGI